MCSKFSSLINLPSLTRGGGGGDKRKRRGREGRGGGGYLREAILLSIFLKGGRLIEGRLLFEEIR